MKSFSELTSASQVNNEDLVAISQSTGNGYASKKTTVGDVTKNVYASNGKLGAKNLNIYPYHYESQEIRGITWTVNSDGTVTANGTATADSNFVCHSRSQSDLHNLILPNGKYIISGCPSGGTASTYSMAIGRTYNGQYSGIGTDYGDGKEVTLNGDDYSATEVEVHLALTIRSGYTANNMVFKPMIRLASDSDATFQPYAMTNLELTKAVESGGGGGTGGHTIIDENGNSMFARAGLQFVGGVNVLDDATNDKTIVDISGGGVVETIIEDTVPNYGTNGTIAYPDGYNKDNTYVLSVMWDINRQGVIGTDRGISVELLDNNIRTYNGFNSQSAGADLYILIAKYVEESGDYYAPVIYSTEEREIGVWTDGKPLYQKTIVLESSMSIASNTWTDIDNGNWSFVDTFVLGLMVNANGASVGFVAVDKNTSNNKLRILQTRSTDITCKSVTIQYTKTSDTAGSGSWTPQRVPTHHYSTEEQIVGTWIDGNTLYEKSYDLTIPNQSGSYVFTETAISGLGTVVKTSYSQNGDGEVGYAPWYDQATMLFAGQTSSGAEFYFRSTYLSGRKLYYTVQYTKSS